VTSDLWVVTSYFNPAGYRTHLPKYRLFRERIGSPLLTVELAYGTDFALGPEDADCLLRFRSDDVLWQKERLLNLAMDALPNHCRFVAWVDADVVFARSDWAEKTREALDTYPLVQPYGRVHDLPAGAEPAPSSVGETLLTRASLGALIQDRPFDPAKTATNMAGVCSPGHAWAATRALVEETGLYDRMIVGSGDNAMAMAAIGHAEAVVDSYRMNQAEARHYRRWAARFHAAVGGRVGYVPGDLYHLWHGDLSDRGYDLRFPGLAPFRFDPERDIALDENGAWKWASDKPELHAYVASYFWSRKEDGKTPPRPSEGDLG
jgi:hypothetical protein